MISKSKKKRLDDIFSKYIRLRDTDDSGYGQCISSGKFIHYSEADAGHFMSRRFLSTRWNERNVNLQGRHANRFDQGQQYSQGLRIDSKYGKGTAEILEAESKKTSHITDFELEILIKHYKSEVKRLLKRKNFDVKV